MVAWDNCRRGDRAFLRVLAVKIFQGGKLETGHRYLLYSFAVLMAAFVVRLILDVLQIEPLTAFGVSARDIGVVVALMFVAASLGQISRVWRNP
jgi:hypothetical protein